MLPCCVQLVLQILYCFISRFWETALFQVVFSPSSSVWNPRCVVRLGDLIGFLQISATLRRRGCSQLRKGRNCMKSSVPRQWWINSLLQPISSLGGSGPSGKDIATKVRPRGRTRSQPNAVVGLVCWRTCWGTRTRQWGVSSGKVRPKPSSWEGPESWYSSFTRPHYSEIHRLACGGPRGTFPVHWRQLIQQAQVRLSEPCVRGSLKLLHNSYLFPQEVAGLQDKFTDDASYEVTWKELPAIP